MWVAAALFAGPLTAPAAAAEQTFTFTGGAQSWTVPDGVTHATFDLYGAQGADAEPNSVADGGLGGRATATIAVTPGETLQINVGGRDGFNGGGSKGVGSFDGGSGGGASDVRRGATDLADRILVAGGGGGAGILNGGAGGGLQGTAGTPGLTASGPGGGGTQSAGGSGGTSAGSGTPGEAGSLGSGGAGGNGCCGVNSGGASGGGGGYYGGGGGGGSFNSGGPGGGGSGFGPAGVAFARGVRAGNGQVTISWDTTPPTITIATPADGANYAVIGPAVIVNYTCTDEPGGSGIASCTGTQPNGSTLPTGLGAIGTHTFTVTATDNAGNVSTVTHTYRVTLLGLGIGPL